MIALYIILGILLLFIVVGLLRLGAFFEYSQEGALLFLKVAFVKIQVFPEKEKGKKSKRKSPPLRKRKSRQNQSAVLVRRQSV